jgi:Ca-activated chloride channel family protein
VGSGAGAGNRPGSALILVVALVALGAGGYFVMGSGGGSGRSAVFVPADSPAQPDEPEAPSAPSVAPAPVAAESAEPELEAAATAPGASFADATVQGSLPKEVITRIVRQNMSGVRLCYEQGLTKNPKLQGRVTVRFAISPLGNVMMASSTESTLDDPEVVRCVVSVFRGLSFPQPEGGPVTVVYPVDFTVPL